MSARRMRCFLALLAALPMAALAQQAPPLAGDVPAATSPPVAADAGDMPAIDMRGPTTFGKLMVDRLEVFDGRDGNGGQWEAQAWYGNDTDKIWLRSEGEHAAGSTRDADVEALWNHAVTAFWDTQLGLRHDFGAGPSRTWAAFGIQGLAPYWLDVEATAYVGASGRTAARVRISYDLLFTQRLVLEPEFEANFYGRDDPARGIGSGLSDARLGLRLRYEIRRRFAPYVGVAWLHRFATTARYARAAGSGATDRQWVLGLRMWF